MARVARAWLAWLPLLILCGGATGATLVPERVTFDSLDRDPATGAPVRIDALLFRPEGPGDVPQAAVVALHGCGGMYSTSRSRRDQLSLRHQAMAELLVGEGYIVLFPDSFRVRGRDEICTVENRRRTITETNRRLDAQGALAFLQARADVAPDRVAVLGWSHGGSAVLAVLDTRQPAVAGWRTRVPSLPYFRAGVAFYPGCVGSLRGRDEYAVAAPLRLFIAGSDDWTAPGPCVDLAHRMSGCRRAGEDHRLPGDLSWLRRADRAAAAAPRRAERRPSGKGRDRRAESRGARRCLRATRGVSPRTSAGSGKRSRSTSGIRDRQPVIDGTRISGPDLLRCAIGDRCAARPAPTAEPEQ